MPRSRSRSFESMTRSCTCSCAAKVPDCCSSLSTSVVLPWSTWAMMAMLRSGRGMRSLGIPGKAEEIQNFSMLQRNNSTRWRGSR
ncbi:hypothetical protein D3C83_60660 [compost metagenome]